MVIRIGPFSLTRERPTVALVEKSREEILGELGGSGTAIWGGFVTQEDYNSDLDSSKMYSVYDKMRMSDGQVRAGLSVIKLPLLAADWNIEPGTDDERDVQIAEELSEALFNKMTITWHDFLRHVLLHLDYGSMPFEKVWEMRDGKLMLRKLAPRMPASVTKWRVDETGGYDGFEQGFTGPTGYTTVHIPSDKSLLFTNEREGSNYRGTSVLRAAYKHWYMKDRMYLIDAIAQEKRGLGVDVMHLPTNASTAQKQAAERALMSLRSHEKNYLTEPEGFAYRTEGLGRGATRDALPSIEHHDLAILKSILAEFINMGSGGGSLAMHKDKSTFFLMALAGIGEQVTSTINRYLIPQWVDFNYPGVKIYPKLEHGRLDTRDTVAVANSVSALLGAGALTADRGMEEDLRELLELPDLPEEEAVDALRRLSAKRKKYANGGRIPKSKLPANFAAMAGGLDSAEKAIMAAVEKTQAKQIVKLMELGQKLITRGDSEGVSKIVVPFKDEIASAIYEELVKVYELGEQEAQKEFEYSGSVITLEKLDPSNKSTVLSFFRNRSHALAGILTDKLRSAFTWETLSQIRVGEFDKAGLAGSLTKLSDREGRKIAQGTVSEALNLGRATVAELHKDEIRKVEYSALLDEGTCPECAKADGRTFKYGSEEMEAHRPPYRLCHGRGNCRCILVFVMEE